MTTRRERIVTNRQFLKSVQKNGITILEGICELIDNSLDAFCTKIWIHIEGNKDGTMAITFVDDGTGIPTTHTTDDGAVHQGIPYAITFAGRMDHEGRDKSPIGKFGWGLTQTACSLSTRTEVYSKTEKDDEWRWCYYDFDELVSNRDFQLPLEETGNPPWLSLPETGTIIKLSRALGPQYKQPKALFQRLVKELGRTYRYFMDSGGTIEIAYTDGTRKSETRVGITDPLMRMDGCRWVAKVGKSIPVCEMSTVFDHNHELGEILDEEGRPARLRFSLVRLDVEAIRKSLGLPLAGGGGLVMKTLSEQVGVKEDASGFTLVRAGREIAHGQTLDLYTRHGSWNFIRAKLEFGPELDGLFGVKTNKSRYQLKGSIRDWIDREWFSRMSTLRGEIAKLMKRLNSHKEEDGIPQAEVVAARATPHLSKRRVPPEERARNQAEIRKEVEDKIHSVMGEATSTSEEKKAEAEVAPPEKRESLLRESEAIVQSAQERCDRIERRFEMDTLIRKDIASVGTGEMFDVRSRGDQAWITINDESEFYENVYKQIEKDPDLLQLVDLMIFSMGYAEHWDSHDEGKKAMWTEARREVSAIAKEMVGTMALDAIRGKGVE